MTSINQLVNNMCHVTLYLLQESHDCNYFIQLYLDRFLLHNWISGQVIYWYGPNHQHQLTRDPRSCSRCTAWEQSERWWGSDPRCSCGNDCPSRRRRGGQHRSPHRLEGRVIWSPKIWVSTCQCQNNNSAEFSKFVCQTSTLLRIPR